MVITRPVVTALVVCLSFCDGLLAKPAKANTAKAKVAASKARTATKSSPRAGVKRKGSAKAQTVRWVKKPAAPVNPGSERIREVQQALIDRGYLRTEATGSWNGDSSEALKRFEAEQKVKVDGKIDSKMLISLGLGPKYDTNLSLPVPGAGGVVTADDSKQQQDQQRN
jgi:peptidoglycan hydrolase-like protein with peptidoglycan-binding domain